jgi:hypothetical protein
MDIPSNLVIFYFNIFSRIPQGFLLKRFGFGSKVIVVRVIFGDSYIFSVLFWEAVTFSNCIFCCGDGYSFKFGDLVLQLIF